MTPRSGAGFRTNQSESTTAPSVRPLERGQSLARCRGLAGKATGRCAPLRSRPCGQAEHFPSPPRTHRPRQTRRNLRERTSSEAALQLPITSTSAAYCSQASPTYRTGGLVTGCWSRSANTPTSGSELRESWTLFYTSTPPISGPSQTGGRPMRTAGDLASRPLTPRSNWNGTTCGQRCAGV